MSISTNVVSVIFGNSRRACGDRILHQRDRGQILTFPDLADQLPSTFQVWFANHPEIGTAVPQTGSGGNVAIPDTLVATGQPIWAWLYLHTGADDGETCYTVTILNTAQPAFTGATPTPAQASAWDEAIEAMNDAIEAAEAAASHGPQIVDGFWYTWDAEMEEYENTDVPSTGNKIWWTTAAISTIPSSRYVVLLPNLNGPAGAFPAVSDLVVGPAPNTSGSATYLYYIYGIDTTTQQVILKGIGSIKGAQGDPGANGVSPSVSVSEITGGHQVSITDAQGAETFDVMDGEEGPAGPSGGQFWSTNTAYTTPSYTWSISSLTGPENGTPAIGDLVYYSTYRYTITSIDAENQTVTCTIRASIRGQQGPAGQGVPAGGTTSQVLKKASSTDYDTEWADESGGGGTSDYSDLTNKPQIAGVTLSGNKSLADLGIAAASDIPAVPVQSVNGKTGAVELNASDVGAIAAPEGGSVGQVLKKTASGTEWANESGGGGMSSAVKAALIQIAQKVAYIDDQGQTYFEDLRDALYTLNSISAVYTQGSVVYTNTPLDDMKADLVVTANYSDSYTETVPETAYTLSGTLVAGTSTVTVSYSGKTTTFNVQVTQYRQPLNAWDFTQSLIDSVGGAEIVLSNSNGGESLPTRDSNGLHFTAGEQIASTSGYTGHYADGRLYEFDISTAVFAGDNSKHKRLFNAGNDNLLIYRNTGALQMYKGSWMTFTAEPGQTIPTTLDELSGKTVGLKLGTDKTAYLYIGGVLVGTRAGWTPVSYEISTLRFGGNATGTAAQGNDIHNLTLTGFRIYQEE